MKPSGAPVRRLDAPVEPALLHDRHLVALVEGVDRDPPISSSGRSRRRTIRYRTRCRSPSTPASARRRRRVRAGAATRSGRVRPARRQERRATPTRKVDVGAAGPGVDPWRPCDPPVGGLVGGCSRRRDRPLGAIVGASASAEDEEPGRQRDARGDRRREHHEPSRLIVAEGTRNRRARRDRRGRRRRYGRRGGGRGGPERRGGRGRRSGGRRPGDQEEPRQRRRHEGHDSAASVQGANHDACACLDLPVGATSHGDQASIGPAGLALNGTGVTSAHDLRSRRARRASVRCSHAPPGRVTLPSPNGSCSPRSGGPTIRSCRYLGAPRCRRPPVAPG